MPRMNVLLLLFITIFIAFPTHAIMVSDVSIRDYLSDSLIINETISIKITNNSDESFLFTPPKQAYGININNSSITDYNTTIKIALECRTCHISIAYLIPDAINKGKNDQYALTRLLNLPTTPENLSYTVYLPPAYVIKSANENDPSIVPSPTSIETDGRRIIVFWLEQRPQLPKFYSIQYHGPEVHQTALQGFKEELSEFYVWILIAVALLAGIASSYVIGKFVLKRPVLNFSFVPKSLLNPDERKIIDLIRENNNKMRQKQVVHELGWSKSKVSAIMTNLEHKQIIKREKLGRNYEVELVKKVED